MFSRIATKCLLEICRHIDSSDNKPNSPWEFTATNMKRAFTASSLRTRPSEVESVDVASGHQDGSYARNTSTILDFMEAGRRNRPRIWMQNGF
ncbi:hypothetical protein ZIOFF_048460 [Zingiber officinale]|uniref:Uncharacterized protein n=1 Tax=Zingiber officinale TaxID=94328 RepID=A0A8J5KXN6_ZINOF|nr:hypothetical protein ZIOFF_048460 [Zingiber officinale]